MRGKCDGRWHYTAPYGKWAKWPSERRTPVYSMNGLQPRLSHSLHFDLFLINIRKPFNSWYFKWQRIVWMSWKVFYLPRDSGEKITLCSSILCSLSGKFYSLWIRSLGHQKWPSFVENSINAAKNGHFCQESFEFQKWTEHP